MKIDDELLTYDDIKKASEILKENNNSVMNEKDIFFMTFFPEIEDNTDYYVVCSPTVKGAAMMEFAFSWFILDENMKKHRMAAVKEVKPK